MAPPPLFPAARPASSMSPTTRECIFCGRFQGAVVVFVEHDLNFGRLDIMCDSIVPREESYEENEGAEGGFEDVLITRSRSDASRWLES